MKPSRKVWPIKDQSMLFRWRVQEDPGIAHLNSSNSKEDGLGENCAAGFSQEDFFWQPGASFFQTLRCFLVVKAI